MKRFLRRSWFLTVAFVTACAAEGADPLTSANVALDGPAAAAEPLSCDTVACCPAGTKPLVFGNGADVVNNAQPGTCVVTAGGSDTVFSSAPGAVILAGPGDDVIMAGPGARVRGGDGRDTINVYGGGTVLGGAGDDVINAANGDNLVVPGPGLDVVACGTGNDTVVIHDLCEVVAGEQLSGGTGNDTLITPVPLARLRALGVVVEGFENIVVRADSCASECVAQPDCHGHGTCGEGAAPGQVECRCDPGTLPPDCQPACPGHPEKDGPGQCGCALPDTDSDGDHVADCVDPCAFDPLKVDPGLAGCGLPETDADHDGNPDYIDPCWQDPHNVQEGECGCVGRDHTPAAAGTPCSGGPHFAPATCDGQGVCGKPELDSPVPGKCTQYRYDGRVYWVCTGSFSWDSAAATCSARPGRTLARVESRTENLFLANVVGAAAWIGAHDATPGDWRWVPAIGAGADAFWHGGAAGSRVDHRFTRWKSGAPAATAASCAALLTGPDRATWADRACATGLGFVCEESGNYLVAPRPPGTKVSDFFPGRSDAPGVDYNADHDGDGRPDCQPYGDVLGNDEALVHAQIHACEDAFAGPNPTCHDGQPCAACVGVAAPPTVNNCEPFTPADQAACLVTNVAAGAADCTDDTSCPDGQVCGVQYVNDANEPDCQACDGAVPTPNCTTRCHPVRRCGTLPRGCSEPSDDVGPCQEQTVCVDTFTGKSDPLAEPASNLSPEIFSPQGEFGDPVAVTPTYPPHPPEGGRFTHSWCTMPVAPLPDRDATDDKQGQTDHSGASALSFQFDPNMSLDYHLTPYPFGETDFSVSAEASFKAGVGFNIKPVPPVQIDIVDAAARVIANRCQISTAGTQVKIFGLDLLPELCPDCVFDSNSPQHSNGFYRSKDACELALGSFQIAADRAKKSLLDAKEILQQYDDLKRSGRRFRNDLCATLVGDHPPLGFPPGNCATESVEDTINRFVDFYNGQLAELMKAQVGLAQQVVEVNRTIPIGVGSELEPKRESQNVVDMTFPLGPIPMKLEVDLMVNYGVTGQLGFNLRPSAALLTGQKEELAFINAQATPFAGAGVSLFVGVGLGVNGFSVSAGVVGEIHLATLSLPMFAGAGIQAEARADERDAPDDLKKVSDGTTAYPAGGARRYHLSLRYSYGACARVDDILSGDISARLRIKIAFFKKTFRATIVHFGGLIKPLVLALVSSGAVDPKTCNAVPAADGLFDWGDIEMPLPFVGLRRVSTPVPAPAPGNARFDRTNVDELFYDGFCACYPEAHECGRDVDCCDGKCFDDPLSDRNECSVCRQPGYSCNVRNDCCDPDDRCVGSPGSAEPGGHCVVCRGQNEPCNSSADCCDHHDCIASAPGSTAGFCHDDPH